MSPVPATRASTMDVQEFQTFYQEKFTLIYRYVYSQVGKREETEDLTSEIFLKAVSGIKYEHSPQSRHTWLYLIARTTIADYWRAHYRLPMSSLDELLEAGWEGPAEEEPTASSSMPAERVQRLLQALPEQKTRGQDLSFSAQPFDKSYCCKDGDDSGTRQSITVSCA